MTMLKKLVGGLATVATVASLAVLPTFVLGSSHGDADLYGGNNDTGYRSRNRNRHDIRTTYRNNRVKRAVVRNTANVTGNTGGNNQNKNTTGGDLDSGEVEVLADVRRWR